MAINGGIKSLEEAKLHLQHMDGVMVGREAYQNPGLLTSVDREIFAVEGLIATRSPWCARCTRISSVSCPTAPIWAISRAICWACFRVSQARGSGVAI